MKMFSSCSGECCVCACGGFCLAGHGDDDFRPANKQQIIENLNKGYYPQYKNYMIRYLKTNFDYDYQAEDGGNTAQIFEKR